MGKSLSPKKFEFVSVAEADRENLLPPVLIEPELEKIALREDVEKVLSQLSSKESAIVVRYYGLRGYNPIILKEIAKELHTSVFRVQYFYHKAMERLRGRHDYYSNRTGLAERLEPYLEIFFQ